MKKTILILFVIVATFLKAQGDNQAWQFGVNFMPFHFTKQTPYVKEMKWVKLGNNKTVNGISAGAFTEKYFTENMGLHIGLEFSNQAYEMLSGVYAKDEMGNWIMDESDMYFNLVSKTKFNYFKLPITILYALSLNSDNFFWVSSLGIQTSFLSYTNTIKNEIDRQGNYENFVANKTKTDNYNKIIFGSTISTGIKFKISDTFSGFTNFRCDYDLSNANKGNFSKNLNSDEYGQLEITDPTVSYSKLNSSKAHNIRLGLEFGIVYNFN